VEKFYLANTATTTALSGLAGFHHSRGLFRVNAVDVVTRG
jgi:hypothetical protein